jgi:hypothetical protein
VTEANFVYANRAIRNREWIRLTVDRSQLWNQWLDVLITYKGRQFELFNGQPCFLTVSTEITNHFEFTFERTLIQRLPSPFESNCVNYPDQFGCLNRAHCVDTCLGNLTLETKGLWPFQLETIDSQFELSSVKFEADDAYNSLRSECSQRFSQPDCETTQHVAHLNRIEMCEPSDSSNSAEVDSQSTERPEVNLLFWHDRPLAWLQDPTLNATEIELTSDLTPEDDPITSDRESNEAEDGSNDSEIYKAVAVIENTPINTDCSSRHVTIAIKYSSEFTTRMLYVPIFDSMQLISNVGQAVSVYLGLCLYDIHRLISTYVRCMRRRHRNRHANPPTCLSLHI